MKAAIPETSSISTIGDQTGRVAVITGANSGLGEQVALVMAKKGAQVVIACRSEQRAQEAKRRILTQVVDGKVDICILDLADLPSIRGSASSLQAKYDRIDLLINNAGLAMPPFSVTPVGVEMQMAVNHLGHFLWTGLLLPQLANSTGSRVVNVTSLGHFYAKGLPDGLQFSGHYKPFKSYTQSKLANVLFTYALERRLRQSEMRVQALVAHPGVTRTNLFRDPLSLKNISSFMRFIPAQSVQQGAMPILCAALDEAAVGGQAYGPGRFFQTFSAPRVVRTSSTSHNHSFQEMLWRESERVSDFKYSFFT